jgi:hypothetical protein
MADLREVARQWAERVWNAQRVEEVAALIHPDHPIGAAGVIASFRNLHVRLTGLEATIERQLVDGTQVATHLKLTASLSGETIGWEAVYIHVIRDGQIVDYAAVSSMPSLD